MKNTLKLTVAFFALLTSATIYANDNTDPIKKSKENRIETVFTEKDDTVYINLQNPELHNVSIEVRDNLDRLVYSERFKKIDLIQKALNFTNAYSGNYYVRVKTGLEIYKKTIEI